MALAVVCIPLLTYVAGRIYRGGVLRTGARVPLREVPASTGQLCGVRQKAWRKFTLLLGPLRIRSSAAPPVMEMPLPVRPPIGVASLALASIRRRALLESERLLGSCMPIGASVPFTVTGEAIAPLPESVAPGDTVRAAGLAS